MVLPEPTSLHDIIHAPYKVYLVIHTSFNVDDLVSIVQILAESSIGQVETLELHLSLGVVPRGIHLQHVWGTDSTLTAKLGKSGSSSQEEFVGVALLGCVGKHVFPAFLFKDTGNELHVVQLHVV